jgi:FkbM family methyltransferase
VNLDEYQKIQPYADVDGTRYFLPNKHCEWRVQTMYTKEPDTVAWIRSMKAGDVFYDVGANIGLYSLMAIKQGLQTFAFEPESQNFAVLIRNMAMNNLTRQQMVAFPFCISNSERVDTLRLSSLIAGGSCHSFASDLNYKREVKEWAMDQGTVGFSLDTLVYELGLPCPTHIKIDVDGFEDKVLEGADRVLDHTQSVLVEMDSANSSHMEWKEILENRGFLTDPAEYEQARRAEGPFSGIGNIIFRRPQEESRNDIAQIGAPDEVRTRLDEVESTSGK